MAGSPPHRRKLCGSRRRRGRRRRRPRRITPLPGHDELRLRQRRRVAGFDATREFPSVRGSPAGARLFKLVLENVRLRPGISVRLGTAARRLIVQDGAVTGVALDEGVVSARARRGPRLRRLRGRRRTAAPVLAAEAGAARPPCGAIPATASGWRRRPAPRSGTCGTITAPTASGIPTPTIPSASA